MAGIPHLDSVGAGGDAPGAVDTVLRELSHEPYKVASALMDESKYAQAIPKLTESIARLGTPSDFFESVVKQMCYCKRGTCYLRLAQGDLAELDFTRAFNCDETSPEANIGLVRVHAFQKRNCLAVCLGVNALWSYASFWEPMYVTQMLVAILGVGGAVTIALTKQEQRRLAKLIKTADIFTNILDSLLREENGFSKLATFLGLMVACHSKWRKYNKCARHVDLSALVTSALATGDVSLSSSLYYLIAFGADVQTMTATTTTTSASASSCPQDPVFAVLVVALAGVPKADNINVISDMLVRTLDLVGKPRVRAARNDQGENLADYLQSIDFTETAVKQTLLALLKDRFDVVPLAKGGGTKRRWTDVIPVVVRSVDASEKTKVKTSAQWKKDGNKAHAKKQFDKAADMYTKAIENFSPDGPVHDLAMMYSNRAASYLEMGEYDLALADATEATNQDPTYIKGFRRLATANYRLGHKEESWSILMKLYGTGDMEFEEKVEILSDLSVFAYRRSPFGFHKRGHSKDHSVLTFMLERVKEISLLRLVFESLVERDEWMPASALILTTQALFATSSVRRTFVKNVSLRRLVYYAERRSDPELNAMLAVVSLVISGADFQSLARENEPASFGLAMILKISDRKVLEEGHLFNLERVIRKFSDNNLSALNSKGENMADYLLQAREEMGVHWCREVLTELAKIGVRPMHPDCWGDTVHGGGGDAESLALEKSSDPNRDADHLTVPDHVPGCNHATSRDHVAGCNHVISPDHVAGCNHVTSPDHVTRSNHVENGNYAEKVKSFSLDDCTHAILASSEQASAKPRDLALLYTRRANCYLEQKQYPLVLADTSKAIEVDPTFVKAYQLHTTVQTQLGHKDAAVTCLHSLLEQKMSVSDKVEVVISVAMLLYREDKFVKGVYKDQQQFEFGHRHNYPSPEPHYKLLDRIPIPNFLTKVVDGLIRRDRWMEVYVLLLSLRTRHEREARERYRDWLVVAKNVNLSALVNYSNHSTVLLPVACAVELVTFGAKFETLSDGEEPASFALGRLIVHGIRCEAEHETFLISLIPLLERLDGRKLKTRNSADENLAAFLGGETFPEKKKVLAVLREFGVCGHEAGTTDSFHGLKTSGFVFVNEVYELPCTFVEPVNRHAKKADTSFSSGDFHAAVLEYTSAIDQCSRVKIPVRLEPITAIVLTALYSNRAAAYIELGRWRAALTDAKLALASYKFYRPAYLRYTTVLEHLKKYELLGQLLMKYMSLSDKPNLKKSLNPGKYADFMEKHVLYNKEELAKMAALACHHVTRSNISNIDGDPSIDTLIDFLLESDLLSGFVDQLVNANLWDALGAFSINFNEWVSEPYFVKDPPLHLRSLVDHAARLWEPDRLAYFFVSHGVSAASLGNDEEPAIFGAVRLVLYPKQRTYEHSPFAMLKSLIELAFKSMCSRCATNKRGETVVDMVRAQTDLRINKDELLNLLDRLRIYSTSKTALTTLRWNSRLTYPVKCQGLRAEASKVLEVYAVLGILCLIAYALGLGYLARYITSTNIIVIGPCFIRSSTEMI